MKQLDIFESNQNRDKGINQSLENAENNTNNWSKLAYKFLLEYSKSNKEFMAEDVRIASTGIVPEPPSKRAWGGVFVRAKINGIIYSNGYSKVSNPKAHRTPATLWRVRM